MDRDIAISGSFNVRDLGGYCAEDGQPIVWRKLFRAGSLSRVDAAGQDCLKNLGIKKIIDLRSQAERLAEPEPFAANEHIELLSMPLFDKLAPVDNPASDELVKRYLEAFEVQGPTFVQVIREIAKSTEPVLFHCTAGKDRTGLIAAMLLALVGVDEDTIIADYALSAGRIQPLVDALTVKAQSQGLDLQKYAPMLACRPDMLRTALAWLKQHYQSVWNYLQRHGYSEADLAQLQRFFGLNAKSA